MADHSPQSAADLIRLIPGAMQSAVEVEQPLAILDLEADIKQEVFFEGRAADGSQIGTYSTEPLTMGIADAQRRFGSQIPTSKLKPRGKNDKGKKATFRIINEDGERVAVLRKGMHFERGWAGFRELMDRPTDKVNLKLTGNMAGSIASGTEGNVSTIGWTNEQARKIAEGNEEHFKGKKRTIIAASTDQIDRLFARLQGAANDALKKILP